ncbi:CHASE domain-containing protein [Nocardioides rubriscoriae]|uniref:CHASE domain-containing protein n=1 Tax=Nocardioides rubriscoriae TaxID=642762 RepID=UPI0011DF462F|nr:CHASE domain-containing protein [Nocardioides rubriscoriae]
MTHDMGSTRRVRRALGVLVVLLVVAAVAASVLTSRAVGSEQRARFDRQTERLDTALTERMTAYVQVLRGGLGLFVASDEVTRADWARYVATLRLDERYPGFKSLSYAPAVRPQDLDDFVAAVRATAPATVDGRPYTLRAPAGSSGTPALHSPILYVAPDVPVNRAVLGVDMMREPARRAAMERAAETGDAVASPRLRLSGSASDEAGFIVYLPVVREGRLLGWLTAAFLAEAFTEGLEVARATDVAFEISDGVGPGAALLHSTAGVEPDGSPRPLPVSQDAAFTSTSEVAVPGGTWQVHYVAPEGFVPRSAAAVPWLVLLLGLLLCVVVVLLARGAERWRRVAVVLDRQSTSLREATAAAQAATLAKSTFLATMSHEIRTPLNAVLGANSVLLETPLQPDQASYAATIRDSGQHLLHVVNDILDLSKAEAGRVVLEHEPFDLERCLDTVLDLVGTEAGRKGLDLSVERSAPGAVVGDVARLRQVLLNLVGNAVKFTPAGGRVVLRVLPVPPEGEDLVAFEVSDTGTGITPDQLAGLFEPYVQAAASVTRTHGGTGLGLTIAQQLVEAMGGTLTVDSTVGEGTTFRFTVRLPAAVPEPEPAPEPAPAPTDGPRTREPLRVLVAEDDDLSRELLAHMVEILGHHADVVGDGEAAVAAAGATDYDVVLLDRRMPGLDGPEAARRIREQHPGPRPRIVSISGSDGGFGAAVDDEVPKPFVLADVAAALDRVDLTLGVSAAGPSSLR